MRVRLQLTMGASLGVVLLDLALAHAVAVGAAGLHRRSHAWSVLSLVLLAVVLALTVLPSRLAALAAGIVGGGIAGNVVSAAEHGGRVPDPLVIGQVAFNVADVFVLLGAPLLVAALARVAIAHRDRIDRLIPPRRWEVALRRRVGL